jgi:hypothetical protein
MKFGQALFSLVLAMSLSTPAFSQKQLEFSRIADTARGVVDATVLTQIYEKAGLDFHVVALPAVRASQMSASGQIDGEVSRIGRYAKSHPNLIRIEPPFSALATAAFFLRSTNLRLAANNSLQGYKIGYVRGITASEEAIAGATELQEVSTIDALFRNLRAGQFEVAVCGSFSGDLDLRRKKVQNLKKLELSRQPLYHYLHEKHRDIAPLISATIRKLSESGELARMMASAEKAYVESGAEP